MTWHDRGHFGLKVDSATLPEEGGAHLQGTIKDTQLPIKIAIMNDSKQQMVAVWQKLFFDNRTIVTDNATGNPDYAALAASYVGGRFYFRSRRSGLRLCERVPGTASSLTPAPMWRRCRTSYASSSRPRAPCSATSEPCPTSACRWWRRGRGSTRCVPRQPIVVRGSVG